MKLVYSLHCTVCSKNFDGRSSWLKHLYQLDHQNKAREKCVKSWFGGKCKDKLKEDETDSLVVIFSSFSLNELTMLESLLERLTEIGGSGFTWITDFVWWPERDMVGYVQFESRKLVNELVGRLDGPNLQVENKLVQLKRAVDIPNLEFNALLPREIANEVFLQESTSKTIVIPTTPAHTPARPSFQIPASSLIPNAKTVLQQQFNSICKSTEIPDDEFNEALKITQTFKDLLTEKEGETEVFMFRNFYLRLRNNGTNNLIIFGYRPVDYENNPNGFLSVDKSVTEMIFQSSQFKERLPGYNRLPPRSPPEGGKGFLHEKTKFLFTLFFYPLHIVEAHLSLLIQYLCSFDPHVKPVLLLVHFWARTNCVKMAEKDVPFRGQHTISPEPSALEWMVILFLAKEGVVPRVREIVERKHLGMSVGEHLNDFGFWMDPEFTYQWRMTRGGGGKEEDVTSDKFILEVVTLAGKFFEFYGNNLAEGCWVLNPKDGEILKREGTRIGKSGLNEEEIKVLTIAQSSFAAKKHNKEISSLRIFVLNPLHITWRLSFCVQTWTEITCGKMRKTGKRLGEYLNVMSSGGIGERSRLTLESALKV